MQDCKREGHFVKLRKFYIKTVMLILTGPCGLMGRCSKFTKDFVFPAPVNIAVMISMHCLLGLFLGHCSVNITKGGLGMLDTLVSSTWCQMCVNWSAKGPKSRSGCEGTGTKLLLMILVNLQ